MGSKYTYIDMEPVDLAIDSAGSLTSTTSNPMPIRGADLVELTFTIVNVTAGALDFTANLQTRTLGDGLAGTYGAWGPLETRAIAAGVETLSARSFALAVTAAAAATYTRGHSVDGLRGDQIRVQALVATAGGATDLISMRARIRIPKG